MKRPETCRLCVHVQEVPGGNYMSFFCHKLAVRRYVDRAQWKNPAKPIPTPDWCPFEGQTYRDSHGGS